MLESKQKSSYLNGMNKPDIKTRVTVLNMLVEGSSMRSTSRVAGVSINTLTKLPEDAGRACPGYYYAACDCAGRGD